MCRLFCVAVLACILAACETLPREGPDDAAVQHQATAFLPKGTHKPVLNYALVDISHSVLRYIANHSHGSIYESFGGGRGPAPEIRVGVGDVVQVSLFESDSGGLFIPRDAGSRPGNFVTLPKQIVDRTGFISVPYAGQVRASGRSLPHIQRTIESRLINKAIEPKAIVELVEQNSSEVTVVGDVNQPTRIKINAAGDRVLDVIAKGGGLKYPPYESYVTLHRRNQQATIYFDALAKTPKENIYVAPGDTVYVYRDPREFIVYGASGQTDLTGNSRKFAFESFSVSLMDAIARAGGLADRRADPRQVFIYRIEPRQTLIDIGVDTSKFAEEQKYIPTIYRANLRDPSGFFYARIFQVRDNDLIYVANSDSVELVKFLELIQQVTTTAQGIGDAKISLDNAF